MALAGSNTLGAQTGEGKYLKLEDQETRWRQRSLHRDLEVLPAGQPEPFAASLPSLVPLI